MLKRKFFYWLTISNFLYIIVLLILAGVTIAMLTGDNGILNQANNAKTQNEIGEEKEQIALAYNGAKADKKGEEVTAEDINGQFTKDETKATATGENVIQVEFNESKRRYQIREDGTIVEIEKSPEVSDTSSNVNGGKAGVIEVEFLSGTSYNTTETPNEPILKDGMKKVYWAKNENGEIDEENIENNTIEIVEEENNNNFKEENWYKYIAQTTNTETKGTSRWANAKTEDGSYYVWIPRYAYRIIYFDNKDHANAYRQNGSTDGITGYSDARGIVDKGGKRPTDVSESKTGISVNEKYFRPHPAFEANVDEGGWDSTLTGIWVMKYEASRNDASETSVGSGTKPKSVPGVQSWRNTSIGDMYTYSLNAYNKDNVINTELNSHMMKNSEWGAIAYLTDSKYGRNGTEVTINDNNSFITADGNIVENKLQSSTGNVYGIYDLSGGAYEYIPAYYKDSSNLSYGSSFTSTKKSDRYSTVYNGTNASSNYIPGDATHETSGWNSDYAYFVNSNYPFFIRGDSYNNGTSAGVFYFSNYGGNSYSDGGFRVCLAVQ